MNDNTTALGSATYALSKGWAPLPIPLGAKAPRISKWTELRFESTATLAEAFADRNVGLILGAASNGLVDIDLDCDEAVTLAPMLLPHTGMRHGRPATGLSHYWYVADRELATTTYDDPVVIEEIKERRRTGLPPNPDLAARLVELRSTGAQTVIPPSTHPSGDVLAWEDDTWGDPREVQAEELALRVRILAAATLLARYWPASGLRHDASLALAGGLLRSGWSEKNASVLVVAVSVAVDPHVDRDDRLAAVASTAERLEQGLDTRGWRTLADFVGGVVVSTVRDWLDLGIEEEPDESDVASDLEASRVDLAELVEHGVPDPEWTLPGLFYREQIHWWHGEPGDGKTYILLGLMYRLAADGQRVLWLDEESGKVQTARRLQSYGAEPEVLRERFIYHARPGLTMDAADLDALFRVMIAEKPDVVVMDSMADMFGQAGVDEDNNTEVTRYLKTVVEPLKFEYGATVICIDHVTKSKDSRGKYARGAGAKKSKTDAAWKVVKHKDFGVNRVGIIRLEADKDRDGWLEPKLAYKIGGLGNGTTVLEPIDAVKAGGNKLPEGELAQRVVEYLRLNADCEADAQITRDVEKAVQGKTAAIREALDELAQDHLTGVRLIERGRSRLWWYQDLSDSIELDFRSLEDD